MVNHEDVRLMLQMGAIDLGDAGKDEIYGYGLVDGAAAAFNPEITLMATRTLGSPKLDAQLTRVADAHYEITINSFDLKVLTVDVFEDDVLRRDLSTSYQFNAMKTQEVIFELDATAAHYSVLFTPYGKPGTSAEVVFRLSTQLNED
jgi:subtilisin